MIGFNSFDDLANSVADYAHRLDLVDRVKDMFIPLAGVRIGRDLESSANEIEVELDAAVLGNPIPLPADFAKPRSLSWNAASGQPISLAARGDVAINQWQLTGSEPAVYNIAGGAINVRPFVESVYRLNYWAIPELSATVQVNDVLVRHPNIYLYGALVELHIWTQDAEQRGLALEAFGVEVGLANRSESEGRFDSPRMVGV